MNLKEEENNPVAVLKTKTYYNILGSHSQLVPLFYSQVPHHAQELHRLVIRIDKALRKCFRSSVMSIFELTLVKSLKAEFSN